MFIANVGVKLTEDGFSCMGEDFPNVKYIKKREEATQEEVEKSFEELRQRILSKMDGGEPSEEEQIEIDERLSASGLRGIQLRRAFDEEVDKWKAKNMEKIKREFRVTKVHTGGFWANHTYDRWVSSWDVVPSAGFNSRNIHNIRGLILDVSFHHHGSHRLLTAKEVAWDIPFRVKVRVSDLTDYEALVELFKINEFSIKKAYDKRSGTPLIYVKSEQGGEKIRGFFAGKKCSMEELLDDYQDILSRLSHGDENITLFLNVVTLQDKMANFIESIKSSLLSGRSWLDTFIHTNKLNVSKEELFWELPMEIQVKYKIARYKGWLSSVYRYPPEDGQKSYPHLFWFSRAKDKEVPNFLPLYERQGYGFSPRAQRDVIMNNARWARE